jgi:hypothetical protein
MSVKLELDDTIVGRWEYRDASGRHCVKGAIEEPVQCPSQVYYNARYIEHLEGVTVIEGVAGFDSTYERAPFRWIWKTSENMLGVGDWNNREGVPADVFQRYAEKIFYMRQGEVVCGNLAADNVNCLPYYRYPRTKDGPKIPELVSHVMGLLPTILFVEVAPSADPSAE